MKNALTLILLFASSFLFGQRDFFSIIKQANEKHEILQNVQQIKEITYVLQTYVADAEFDTTLIIDGEPVGVYLEGYTISKYKSPLEVMSSNYDQEGVLSSKLAYLYSPEGLMLSEIMDLGDSPGAAFMNTAKTFEYDESGRLINSQSVNPGTGEDKGNIAIRFREDGLVESIIAHADFGRISLQATSANDTIRYLQEMEMNPEMVEMFSLQDKKIPKAHTDIVYDKSCDCHIYFSKEENLETGEMAIRSIVARDKNYNTLSEQSFNDGECYSHKTYTYAPEGRLLSQTNVLDDVVSQNEYFENGKIKVEYEDLHKIEYEYDQHWNYVKKITRFAEGDVLSNITVREILYK